MVTKPAARRTAAALTAALVAVLLVTFGGPTRTAGQRVTAGPTHSGATVKPARVPQAVAPGHHQQTPLQLDITTTQPSSTAYVPENVSFATPESTVVRLGRDVVTPTGRAPPAL